MTSFKAIIVDDEKHGRDNLRAMILNYCPTVKVTAEAGQLQKLNILFSNTNLTLFFSTY